MKTNTVADEVEANIAEYAVMVGISWDAACRVAYKNYYTVLTAIHRKKPSNKHSAIWKPEKNRMLFS